MSKYKYLQNNGELRHEKLLVFSIWDFVELVFAFPFSSNYDQISSSLGCDVKKDLLSPQKIGSILVLHMHIALGIIFLGIQFYAQEKKRNQ